MATFSGDVQYSKPKMSKMSNHKVTVLYIGTVTIHGLLDGYYNGYYIPKMGHLPTQWEYNSQ